MEILILISILLAFAIGGVSMEEVGNIKDINIVNLATAPMGSPSLSPSLAPAPPPGPHYVNVTDVLKQAGQFNVFLSLLQSTPLENQLQTQANNTQQGLTLFAPSDAAFKALRPKYKTILNKLTDQAKISLLEYHAVPTFYTLGQFQSLSNPISTMGPYKFNVSAFGAQVNMSTGLVNAPITSSVFSQSPVAVYAVNKVLLPEEIFGLPSPTPAPSPEPVSAPASAMAPSDDTASPSSSDSRSDKSDATYTKSLSINSLFLIFGVLVLLRESMPSGKNL